jgi:hypothetical protein
MTRRRFVLLFALAAMGIGLAALLGPSVPQASGQGEGAIKTQVVKAGDGWQLMRGGKPFFVKGVGGDFSKEKLVAAGGNAFRTWGTPGPAEMDEAQKLGLAVCVGIWLGGNPGSQVGLVQGVVTKFKDHPATLMWGLGNEMEGAGNDPNLWKGIETLAAACKKLDPNHPTITVIAEMGGQKIQNIHKYCPSLDIIGINSYAGAASLPERYKKAGGTKPYIITEYGPPGQWECAKTPWGAALEMTSSEKAEHYRKTWTEGIVANKGIALGGFAFLWGNKNEATPTWYGMIMTDGTRLGCVDALQKEWTGKAPANLCPIIKSLKLAGPTSVKPGTTVKASVDVSDSEKDALTYKWVLMGDSRDNRAGGGAKADTTQLANAIVSPSMASTDVKLPDGAGAYRLYVYIRDGKGNGALGNIPIQTK